MPLTEIRVRSNQSRADALYEQLRELIVRGELRPGERLVEEQIASKTLVSRTPVREALRRLQTSGLVKESGRGIVVTSVTLDELADLCAVRETLEAMAVRLAAQSRSELELATLRQLLAESHEALEQGDVSRLVALNDGFHETLWQASRNRYLAQQLHILRVQVRHLQDTTLNAMERRAQAIEEHEQLLDAIARRDGEAAAAILQVHVRNAVAIRLAWLRQRGRREE